MRAKITLAGLIILILCASVCAETPEARAAFAKGHELLEKGEYYPAIAGFKQALEDQSYPLLDYSYFFIAQAYEKSYHYKEAAEVYQIVVDHFGNSVIIPKALFGAGRSQARLKKFTESSATLRRLIAEHPKHELIPEARYLLGMNLEQLGQFEDAARVYQNLDLLHPNSDFAEKAIDRLDLLARKKHLAGYEAPAATIYNLGIKYFKKRNYVKAKGYFTRLSQFYKRSSFYDEAIFMLGRIFLRRGKLSLATRYFKKAINLNKDSKPEAMYYLALTYAYLGSPQTTVYTMEKLVSLFPNSHTADDALYYLGRYYRNEGKIEQAVRYYEKLAALHPYSELYQDAIWHIGNIHFKQRDYEKAYAQFSRALDLPQTAASDKLIFWAAKCAERTGKTAEAIAAYRTTISRYDHSYYGYRAREELARHGIEIKASAVPDAPQSVEEINGSSPETASHEEKYRELLAVGLGDEAAEEASFLVEKVPLSKKDKARLAQYHAYVMKGRYARPIDFAEKKIEEAMLAGSLASIDPRLWRFSYPRGYNRYVEKYSKMYGLDPYLTYAVIREESRFKSRALSRSWAHGLMQIMPGTGRKLSRLLGMRYSRWKLYEPRVNIHMGTYYLSNLIKSFDGNVALALAGYNGGPHRVRKWAKKYPDGFDIDEFIEDIPLRETRYYVKKVLKSYYGYKRTYASG